MKRKKYLTTKDKASENSVHKSGRKEGGMNYMTDELRDHAERMLEFHASAIASSQNKARHIRSIINYSEQLASIATSEIER